MSTYLVKIEEELNGIACADQFYLEAEDTDAARTETKLRLDKQGRTAEITEILPAHNLPGHPPSN